MSSLFLPSEDKREVKHLFFIKQQEKIKTEYGISLASVSQQKKRLILISSSIAINLSWN